MKPTNLFPVVVLVFAVGLSAHAQKKSVLLKNDKSITPVQVNVSEETYKGKNALKVTSKGDTEEQFVKINDLDFKDGVIEVELSGNPGEGASDQARGFVGIAFHIANDNSKFECIYIRPTNGRADDQLRRNHSTQYISAPDFPWYKLREQFPGKYESYVDLVSGEWTKLRIEVKGDKAKLFVHDNPQPALIINDLKMGATANGSIGLWIGPGTDARFTNLSVSKN